MSKLREGRTIVTSFLLGLALYFLIEGLGYGRNSRIFPLAVGVPTVILTALTLIAIWKPSAIKWADVHLGASSAGAEGKDPEGKEEINYPSTYALRMIGWLILGAVGIGFFGFRVAVPIYIALFGRLEGRVHWVPCILVGIFCWAFIIGYFELFMKFSMFKGVLFGDLLPIF